MSAATPIRKRGASSIERLPQKARALAERLLAEGQTYEAIIGQVRHDAGVTISRSSLSRFRRNEYEPARQRIDAAKAAAADMMERLKTAGSVDAQSESVAQALFSIYLQRVLEMEQADVVKLSREARMFQDVDLRRRKQQQDIERLELDRERLALDKKRLERELKEFEEREEKAKKIASGLRAGKSLTPDQVAAMRGAYGLD